ncbi:MAG: ChaN family lipoprotein [Planctomycetota bacterium]
MLRYRIAVALLALLVQPLWAADEVKDDAPVSLDRVTRIFDTKSGAELNVAQLVERLAVAEAVFLGETHVDEVTHRVEDAVYAGLLERHEGRVVLAMEMFTRDQQQHLDAYVSGQTDEKAFRRAVRGWSNYATGYRPMVERARARGAKVVGSNLPRKIQRKVGFGGKEAWDALTAEEKALVPPELHSNTEAYWERFARAVRGHAGMMGEGAARVYSVQSLWDNCMGWSCAQALSEHPDHRVLHINGGFHTLYRDGTARQFALRAPGKQMLVVDINAVSDLAGVGADLDPKAADFVVFAQRRAHGVNEGVHGVSTVRDLEYRLHLPRQRTGDVPLLVYLAGDGLSSKDALQYWRTALGDQVALAIVDHPYPQLETNLYRSGRWYWDDRFSSDLGALHTGVARLCDYLPRYYPVDGRRIVIAGDGSGATVAVAIALYRGDLPAQIIATEPRRFGKLRELGLPDPTQGRYRHGDAWVDLQLFLGSDSKWWQQEMDDYRNSGVGVALNREDLPYDAAEAAMRNALGVAASSTPKGRTGQLLVLFEESRLAGHWAQLLARAYREKGDSPARVVGVGQCENAFAAWKASGDVDEVKVVPLGFAPEQGALPFAMAANSEGALAAVHFADARALPLCPGPFGGTTVVVVPEAATADEWAQWQQLEADDVLKLRSRFARLKVARPSGDRGLEVVLQELVDAGKSNVLIVPALYHAEADLMLSLQAETVRQQDALQINWLPGLGGRLSHLVATAAKEGNE